MIGKRVPAYAEPVGILRDLMSRVRPSQRRAPSPSDLAHKQPDRVHTIYAPDLDGDADPGEIVWTWVPYEDDPAQGKDRPVLLVARTGSEAHLLGVMLSSKDHDDDRNWLRLGTGAWDGEGRPSWVRLDRVIRIDGEHIRREGAVLDRQRFDGVVARLRPLHGWD
jgi:PemK-like, MazF-like toxin of type II toxin-antitoxin system